MKITIHRGAGQIGGCITEIASGHSRILIDLGSNLPGSPTPELTREAVAEICSGTDAIFYTHYHGDHVGLMTLAPESCDQYIGEGALQVMLCKHQVLNQELHNQEKQLQVLHRMKTYHTARPIPVAQKNEILVTPYFVSHSAFDSYMFKIECEGKVILHTGDFRIHGYLGKGLLPTLEKYIGRVDILITEGTMLGRTSEHILTENELKHNAIRFLKEHKYTYALCSSTDIDRLASFHAACKAAGRKFYVDPFQHQVLDIFTRYAGPHADLFKFDAVYQPDNYRSPYVHRELSTCGFLRLVRTSHLHLIQKMMQEYTDVPSWLIYSMWSGYAEKGKSYSSKEVEQIRSLFQHHIADGVRDGFHTSGHADITTLQKVCRITDPRIGIIPIHKEASTDYGAQVTQQYPIFRQGTTRTDGVEITIK